MAVTYEPIASQTLSTNTATVTFSDLPGTYTDLRIIVSAKTSDASSQVLAMRLNGNTGTNYSNTRLYGNGSTVSSDRFSNATRIDVGYMSNSSGDRSHSFIDIMSYANTNVFKTVLNAWESQGATPGGGAGTQFVLRQVGLFRSTGAITSVSFAFDAGNIVSGSTFSLFGVKAA